MESSAESTTEYAESSQAKQKQGLLIRDELEDVILTHDDVRRINSRYPDYSFEGISVCTDIHESTTETSESSQTKQKQGLLIRDELEEVILTNDDVRRIISRYPDYSFEGISVCTDIHDFRRHSPRSESDVAPLSEFELSSDENDDSEDAEGQKKSRMTLRHCQNRLPTVSLVSEYSVCEWNSCAEIVFKAFRVKSFIVEPDYFISATMSHIPDKWNDFATMDHILHFMQSIRRFHKWSDVEKEIDLAVQPLDGCKDIPHIMTKPDKEEDLKLLITKFMNRIIQKQNSVSFDSDIHSWFLALESFAKDLAAYLFGTSYIHRENLCQNYVFALLNIFQRCTGGGIDFHVREKKHLSLDLRDKTKRKGRVMSLWPDLMILQKDSISLVGEVEGCRRQTKNEKPPPKKDEPQKTEEVALPQLPQLPSNESSSGDQNPINLKDKDVAHDLALGKRKWEESDPCSATQPKLVKTATKVVHDAVKQSDTESTSAKDTSGASSSKEGRNKKFYFRPLRTHEEYKVEHFLPQLFADMLACMADSQRPGAKIGCKNEKVQLGFAVDGFMWRFVKLVVRHTGHPGEVPSVSLIRSPNVVCDLFLTKEYNLFNKHHVKMIFQMLYVICHLNDIWVPFL